MSHFLKTKKLIPHYRGKAHTPARLPRTMRDWATGGHKSIAHSKDGPGQLIKTLHALNKSRQWHWPNQKIFFLSDLHGDPEALVASLVASGGVHRTGSGPLDFTLTHDGKKACFVIGGDCFDKGPSSLGVLRGIAKLRNMGAKIRVLAGNHDLRVFLGLSAVGQRRTAENQHFFIRTGPKILPLLREIKDTYLTHKKVLKKTPSARKCRQKLFPEPSWFQDFPNMARGRVRPGQIKRELHRIHKKHARFDAACKDYGLSLRDVYAAALKWQELFLHKNGEFSWFFNTLRLTYHSGSFLFVHAGVDNAMAHTLAKQGSKAINRTFATILKDPPFDFYYGSLCNSIRTKYRHVDRPFDKKGARHLRRAGIAAIVHGHRNVRHGQRIATRCSVLHFECDTSLDRHTRRKEKIRGPGASVTIIDPRGYILGISSDYPHVKVFTPEQTLDTLRSKPLKRWKVAA